MFLHVRSKHAPRVQTCARLSCSKRLWFFHVELFGGILLFIAESIYVLPSEMGSGVSQKSGMYTAIASLHLTFHPTNDGVLRPHRKMKTSKHAYCLFRLIFSETDKQGIRQNSDTSGFVAAQCSCPQKQISCFLLPASSSFPNARLEMSMRKQERQEIRDIQHTHTTQ